MRWSLLFLFFIAIVSEAGGQSDSAVARWPEIGSRVRVTTYANRAVTGDLVNLRGDTLVVRTARQLSTQLRHIPAGKVELIPGSAVAQVEVSRGRGFQVERVIGGALLGAAAGLAVAGAADVAAEAMLGDFGEFSPNYGKAAGRQCETLLTYLRSGQITPFRLAFAKRGQSSIAAASLTPTLPRCAGQPS